MKKAAILVAVASLATLVFASTADAHRLTFNQAVNVAEKVTKKDCTKKPNCVAYGVNLAEDPCSSVNVHKVSCNQHLVVQNPDGSQIDCHRSLQMFIKRGFSRRLIFYRYRSSETCSANTHPVSASRMHAVG